MKRLFLSLVFIALSFCCSAQWFVSGDISFGYYNKGAEGMQLGVKRQSFGINPAFGYIFGKVGLAYSMGYGIDNQLEDVDFGGEIAKKETRIQSLRFSPFVRYVICKFHDISFYTDMVFRLSFESSKNLNEGVTEFEKNVYGIELRPALSYGLTDRLIIFSKFNFLTLGYYHTVEKGDFKTFENQFGFGINNSTVVSAGLVYVFK
ncbi:MAG: hypothetical protein ACI358_08270 [Candidatus Limimorpha sp.]